MGRQRNRKCGTLLEWIFNSLPKWHLPVVFRGFVPFLFDLITTFLISLYNFSLIHLASDEPEIQETALLLAYRSRTNSNVDVITTTTLENILM